MKSKQQINKRINKFDDTPTAKKIKEDNKTKVEARKIVKTATNKLHDQYAEDLTKRKVSLEDIMFPVDLPDSEQGVKDYKKWNKIGACRTPFWAYVIGWAASAARSAARSAAWSAAWSAASAARSAASAAIKKIYKAFDKELKKLTPYDK